MKNVVAHLSQRPVRNKRGQGGGGMGADGEPMVDEDGNELDAGGAVGGRKARGKRRPPAIDFDAPVSGTHGSFGIGTKRWGRCYMRVALNASVCVGVFSWL